MHSSSDNFYKHNFDIYWSNPEVPVNVTIVELFHVAIERLKVLNVIEMNRKMDLYGLDYTKEDVDLVRQDLEKQGLTNYTVFLGGSSPVDIEQIRRRDHISLVLMMCLAKKIKHRTEWIIRNEFELFKLRYASLGELELLEFLKRQPPPSEPINDSEKKTLINDLVMIDEDKFEETKIYKVPFLNLISLSPHEDFLKGGMVYLPESMLFKYYSKMYLCHLRNMPQIITELDCEETEKIFDCLKDASNIVPAISSGSWDGTSVSKQQLEKYASKHFPLCMRHIHDCLKKVHHLKYRARCQYWPFLRAIGLSLEDNLAVMKEEFTKIMTEDEFAKKRYEYYIKYVYGLVGRKQPTKPMNCMEICELQYSSRLPHGCPYKNWDPDQLKEQLSYYGNFSCQDIEDIVRESKAGRCQTACGLYFRAVHKVDAPKITHPNEYFCKSTSSNSSDNEWDCCSEDSE